MNISNAEFQYAIMDAITASPVFYTIATHRPAGTVSLGTGTIVTKSLSIDTYLTQGQTVIASARNFTGGAVTVVSTLASSINATTFSGHFIGY